MFNAFDILKITKQFIPPHKQVEIQDRIVDTLARAFPDEPWHSLIQAYRSDAAFQDALATALKRAVQGFAVDYEDRELVAAVIQDTHFWDIPSVQSALQEIVTRPSSYLHRERKIVFRSFADVLPTVELERVEPAVHFFLRCLTQEVITIPQLAPIYQVQFQWASLEQSHQLVDLQRDHNQLLVTLLEAVAQSQRLLATPSSPILPKAHDNLPPQYGEFLGREKDIKRVLDALNSRWPIISIEGLGGMGKTTLALQAAHHCLSGPQAVLDPPFEYVVWVSAKDRPEQKLWLNEVLDTTARILGYTSITQLPLERIEQRKAEVSRLLHNFRILLIIDNFETIQDSALESWIQDIPGPSKVLITSRTDQLRRIGTRPINLVGLETPEALELIRNYAQSLGLQSIETAKEDKLLPFVKVTGGNPKVIGMALGYVKRGRLSLNEVIEHLHTASKTVNSVFDDLFARIWRVMTKNAQHILLVMPFFEDFASKEALGATSGLTEYHLDDAVEELVELKLLDIREESAALSQHYSVHPLTRAFAKAQLRNTERFEEQARRRWSKYYLDFAAHHLIREQPKERYWNTLMRGDLAVVHQEWPNLRKLLTWADQDRQDHLLVELMLLLVHYMDMRLLYPERLFYARRAAEAANRLGQQENAALFYVDALGWILIEEGHLLDAEQAIRIGLHIAENMNAGSLDAIDCIALANAFLARILLEQGKVEEASKIIKKALPMKCRPVIQVRISMIAGDIACKKNSDIEALGYYEYAHHMSLQYIDESREEDWDVHYRWGLAFLANGNIVQAETLFNRILSSEHHFMTIEMIYATYGLAYVAYVKGEKDKARQLAQEALGNLSHAVTSHVLLSKLHDFLKHLEED